MKLTRTFLSVVFILFASTALAAKPTKDLVCHVGNDRGSADQTYAQNPDCTPTDGWDAELNGEFRCPDAGKVDLILVSKKASHVGNESHVFTDETGFEWVDFIPEDGVGDDPLDFEEGDVLGIDRGCELAEENLTCPCWNSYTESSLVNRIESESPDGFCDMYTITEYGASTQVVRKGYEGLSDTWIHLEAGRYGFADDGWGMCRLWTSEGGNVYREFDRATGQTCGLELSRVRSQITGCPQD